MRIINLETGENHGSIHYLTIEQQSAFMKYMSNHPVHSAWKPLFTILSETGCRIGEAFGLTWNDLDFENRKISVNRSVAINYFRSDPSEIHVSKPKTKDSIRTIPMSDAVYDAFYHLRKEQTENGSDDVIIDGISGFILINQYGVKNTKSLNHTIMRICEDYNSEERINAENERRDPFILPYFSCYEFRHTFLTRLHEIV